MALAWVVGIVLVDLMYYAYRNASREPRLGDTMFTIKAKSTILGAAAVVRPVLCVAVYVPLALGVP